MNSPRIRSLLLVFLLFFNLSACSDPDKQKVKHYQKALEYIKTDNDKAAILELKNALKLDAKFADAHYQLGLLYVKAGVPKAAFSALQRATSLDKNNLDAGIKVAEFHLLARQKDESRKYVEQVLKVDNNYTDGLALLSNLELIEGNFSKAADTIDRALAQAPESDKLYNIKGRILIAQNKWEESENLFQKAIAVNPDNFNNYSTMLMFYEQRKNEPAIQELLNTMVSKFPENPQLRLMLANRYQKKGDLDKAEIEIKKIVEIKKYSAPSRLLLTDFYIKHQLFEKAEEVLISAIDDFPEDIQLQIALAELSFDLQKFDQTQSIMESVLATNPANGGANLIKARFLIKEGKNIEAIELITPLTTNYPKWADPFYYSALIQLRIGKLELAQQTIERALQIKANNDRYHALAAQINLSSGNSREASKEATLALRINPRNAIALKILAKSLVQAKEYDKAVELIEKLNPKAVAGDVEILGTLGLAYLGQDNREKARETFADLLQQDPGNSKALAFLTGLTVGDDIPRGIIFVKEHIAISETAGHYLLLGDLLTKNKQFEEALQAYQKVQQLAPDNPQSYVLSARILNHLGKIDETIAQYEELLQTNPNSIAGIMGLAAAYQIQGKTDKAKEKYIRALEIQPNLPAAANNLAWLLASEEGSDLGEALRLAMQAKQALPDQPHIADTLGWVHYKRKSYSLAISQFRQALENRPDDPTIQYHLALGLYGNGEKREAIESLQKALQNKSQFEDRGEAETLLKKWTTELASLSAQ